MSYQEDINNIIIVYHSEDKDTHYLCEPQEAKTRNLPKWFCPKCNRYVLPDGKKHWAKFKPSNTNEG